MEKLFAICDPTRVNEADDFINNAIPMQRIATISLNLVKIFLLGLNNCLQKQTNKTKLACNFRLYFEL